MQASDHFYHPGRDTNSGKYVPQARHCVENLGEVDKEDVEIPILFLTFLLDLSCSEYHVYCPSVLGKTTLAFWYCLMKKLGMQPVQDDLAEHLACNTEKGDPTVAVSAGFVTFAFVQNQMDYSGILQILG